jgi:hypothetical protein
MATSMLSPHPENSDGRRALLPLLGIFASIGMQFPCPFRIISNGSFGRLRKFDDLFFHETFFVHAEQTIGTHHS